MTAVLGRLERVDLRQIWSGEASDFTPWMSEAGNLEILGDTIGIELELEAQEKNVGPFRADLLCKDTATDSWVLIENQLERTDHSHLGQLMTYAAGLQAVTLVWVSARFTEEHRAALDWLNDITDSRFRFFGLEVELWRIGDSLAAPRFNVVSKPNDWTKLVNRAARALDEEALSETRALQLRYWTALNELMEREGSPIRTRTPRPRHWTTFPIGRAGFYLAAAVSTVDDRLKTELFIQHDSSKSYFRQLESQRAEIEREFGEPLAWEELPDRKGSRVALYKDAAPLDGESEWPGQHAWIRDSLIRFDRVFRQRVRALQVDEALEAEEV